VTANSGVNLEVYSVSGDVVLAGFAKGVVAGKDVAYVPELDF